MEKSPSKFTSYNPENSGPENNNESSFNKNREKNSPGEREYMDFNNPNILEELGEKAFLIHKSTATDIKKLGAFHNFLRSNFKFYYNWHLNPQSGKIHKIALFLYLFFISELAVLLALTPLKLPENIRAAPSLVQTSGNIEATAFSNQRGKILKASDGTLIVIYQAWSIAPNGLAFSRSIDGGQTWFSGTQIDGSWDAYASAVILANDDVILTYTGQWNSYNNPSYSVKVRRLTWNGVTRTWSVGATITAVPTDATTGSSLASLAQDASGYFWIASRYTTDSGTNWQIAVVHSSNPNDETAWGSPIILSSADSSFTRAPTLVPFSTKLACIYTEFSTTKTLRWRWRNNGDPEGTWQTEANVQPDSSDMIQFRDISAVADDAGNIHLLYVKGAHVKYRTYTTSWSSYMTMSTGGDTQPNIATDGTNLWAFWTHSVGVNNYSIIYKKYEGGAWSGENNFIVDGLNNRYISTISKDIAFIPLIWTEGTASPYNIKFEKIAILNTPTIDTPSNVTTTSIQWNWTDNSSGEDGFKIHDANNNTVGSVGANVQSWNETSLSPNTSYTRHVHAYNTYGDGDPSASVTRYTLASAPTNPSAVGGWDAINNYKVTVSWSSGGSQNHFHVYRDGPSGTGTLVYDSTSTSFVDANRSANTTYSYYIYAVNGESVENPTFAINSGAPPESIGSNFMVNDSSSANQLNPCVAYDTLNNFIITWYDFRNGNADIYAKRFDSSGTPIGADFQVNNASSSTQDNPSIATDSSNNFIITWHDLRGGDDDIYARRFDSSGNPLGNDFQVNDASAAAQLSPSIATDLSNKFIITWRDDRAGNADIYAKRFNSSGSPIGADFQVNNASAAEQYFPHIATDSSNNFIVTWHDLRGGDNDIYARRFDSSGNPIGADFQVNDASAANQSNSSIATDFSNNFIITWRDNRNGNWDIYAKRFNSSGSPVGADFQVNETNSSDQQNPSIATDSNNNFIITWHDLRNGNLDIFAKRFNSSGSPVGADFQVNETNSSDQQNPSIATDSSNNFIITWRDDRNGNPDIYAQRFRPSAPVSALTPPAAPTMNVPSNITTSSIQWNWTSVAGATSYNLHGGSNPGDDNVIQTGITGTNYNESSLSSNINRYRHIHAVNASGAGAPSGEVNKWTLASAPTNPSAVGGWDAVNNYKVTVSWSSGGSQDHFHVYRDGPSGTGTLVYDSTGTSFVDANRSANTTYSYYIYAVNGESVENPTFAINSGSPEAKSTDFLVNTPSATQVNPTIAHDSNNNFIITWGDNRDGDSDIYARRFDSSSNPLGSDFRVNDVTTNLQLSPSDVATDSNNNFIITWTDARSGTFYIYAKRYDSAGNPIGSDFKVNDGTNLAFFPSIATDSNNNFIITWQDLPDGNYDIYARRFDSSGNPLSSDFRVDTDSGSANQYWSSITTDRNNNFIISWYDGRNGNDDIYARRFDSSGNPMGNDFQVNDANSANQNSPYVTTNYNNYFIIVWMDYRNNNYDIYAKIYNSQGSVVKTDFMINRSTSANQTRPAVKVNRNNNFVFSWEDERNGNDDIYGRIFNASGSALTSDFRIDSDTGSANQRWPDISIDSNDNFVTAWYDGRNGDNDIYARCFRPSAPISALTPPAAPTMNAPTNVTTSSIQWNWSGVSGSSGYNIYNASNGALISTTSGTSYNESNLTPNTSYSRYIRAYNGSGEGAPSNSLSKYTSASSPDLTSDKLINNWYPGGTNLNFYSSSLSGNVAYLRYAWTSSPRYSFNDREAVWSSGTLSIRTSNISGDYWMYVKGYNSEGVSSGTLSLGPFKIDGNSPSLFSLLTPPDSAWNNVSPIFSWQASSDSHSGLLKYQLYINGLIDREIEPALISISPLVALPEGANSWYIRAVDQVGNYVDSEIRGIKIDGVTPSSQVESLKGGETFYKGDKLTISGSAFDYLSGVEKVEISTDGGVSWRRAQGTDHWSYSWDINSASEHKVISRAYDVAGNVEENQSGPIIMVEDKSSDGGIPFFPEITNFVGKTVDKTMKAINKTSEKVAEFVEENPEVSTTALGLGAAAGVAASTAGGFSIGLWLSSIINSFLFWFFHLFTALMQFLGIWEKPKQWGTVYNSVTKRPIRYALVRLIGPVIQTVVTDKKGRFGFIAPKGEYTIEVKKPSFVFPSHYIVSPYDRFYSNLYFGQNLKITKKRKLINLNIPLDPVWIKSKEKKAFKLDIIFLRKTATFIGIVLVFCGTILTLLLLLYYKNILFLALSLFYLLLFAMNIKRILYAIRFTLPLGKILDAGTEKPLPGTVVELYQEQRLIEAKLTLKSGEYNFFTPSGKYVIKAKKPNYIFVPKETESKENDPYIKDKIYGEPYQGYSPE